MHLVLVRPLMAGLLLTLISAMVVDAADIATIVVRYTPFHAGHLRPDLVVTRYVQGYCWTGSIAVPRTGGWRCMSGNGILDPCFSSPSHAKEVVCIFDPFSRKVTLMSLTRALDSKAHGPVGESHPWMLRLANGDVCGFATGATGAVDGERLNYACRSKGWIAGEPDRSTPAWKANYVRSIEKPAIRKVNIAVAVF